MNFTLKRNFVRLFNLFHIYKPDSIRYKLTVLVILIVLIPMSLAGIYFYWAQSSNLTNNINKELVQMVQITNSRIEAQFTIINDASLLFLSNPIIKDNLVRNLTEDDDYLEVQKKIAIENQLSYSLFYNYAWDTSLIKSIFIFSNENHYYYLLRHNIADTYEIDNNIKAYEKTVTLKEESKIIPPSLEDNTIYFMRRISDLNRKNLKANMIFGIDENVLGKIYEDVLHYNGIEAFIFDDHGIILSDKNKKMLGKSIDPIFNKIENPPLIQELPIKNETYFVVMKKINNYNLTSCIAVPKKEIMRSLSRSTNNYLYLTLILIFFSAILGAYLSSRVIKPVNVLMKNISKLKDGDFSVKMNPYKAYELNQLSEVFNKMIDEIQYLFHQVYEKQLLLKESELKSLQAQINPHFLFNVLEIISWNARMSENETIYKMVSYLGKFIRANITTGAREKITIRQELEYIEIYIYLQKMRFEDKLNVTMTVEDDSILDYYLPTLCIQPLVENAIVHGIEEKIGNSNLAIIISNEKTSIHFEIIDDGIGFDTTRVDFNYNDSVKYRKEGHTSIGIYNSNKRIKLLYGDEYGISIQSKLEEGTKVSVYIPFDRGEL